MVYLIAIGRTALQGLSDSSAFGGKATMTNPWICATLVSVSGAAGGVVNALLTDNGFILPTRVKEIWCPGFISNVVVGTFSAFASWSFYGSGAGLDISGAGQRTQISLTFSALAGAFMVGVAGARWITNEVDKRLLSESVKVAAKKEMSHVDCNSLVNAPPKQILETLINV
jgi:hypothetical protein